MNVIHLFIVNAALLSGILTLGETLIEGRLHNYHKTTSFLCLIYRLSLSRISIFSSFPNFHFSHRFTATVPPISVIFSTMARTIYLAIFTNGPKRAHWSIWIPKGGEGTLGKIIHVIGNPATGFFLEFKRNYDFQFTSRRHTIIPLGQVLDQMVADGATTVAAKDTTARDRLESAATVVPPPGRSAGSVYAYR